MSQTVPHADAQARLNEDATKLAAAEAELAATKAELARARQALAEAGNEDELRRLMEEEAAMEKEKRVEHLGQMAARRLGKKELSAGFETWAEAYWEAVRRRNMLKQAGSRLTKPKLVASYRRWHDEWAAEQAAAAAAEQRRRLSEELARRQTAEGAVERARIDSERMLAAMTRERDILLSKITELDGGAVEMELRCQAQSANPDRRRGKAPADCHT